MVYIKKSIFYALNGKLHGWNDKHLGLDKKLFYEKKFLG